MSNGVTLKLDWQSDNRIVVTAISSDGTLQAHVPADLLTHEAALSGTFQLKSEKIELCESNALSFNTTNDIFESPVESASPIHSMGEIGDSLPSVIEVLKCGAPVNNAFVEMVILQDGPEGKTFTLPGQLSGPGQYVVFIPKQPTYNGLQVEQVCKNVVEIIGNGCIAVGALGPNAAPICLALAAAVDTATGGPTGEAILIEKACLTGFAVATGYCATIGNSPVPGAPSAADYVCNSLREVTDRFVEGDIRIGPEARLPGGEFLTSPFQTAPASGPFPSFTLDSQGEVEITSFTTEPIDPAPMQGYTATAKMTCAAPGTQATMSIVGTDGYTDSITCDIEGEADCSLVVPGAKAGISDTVTVDITDGPKKTVALIF